MIFAAVAALAMPACKKADKKKKADPSAAKTTEKAGAEKEKKAAEPGAVLTVTSKSPEAVAAFEKGRDLVDNLRAMDAMEHFKKAIELDADFAQAHAYLGRATPGADGAAELEKAVALAAALPEAEKTVIQAMHLQRNGDAAGAMAAWKKAAELAPGEWRLQLNLGTEANRLGRYADAVPLIEKAREIKPDLAVVHNGLAYAYAGQAKWDEAIAAAQKQAELLPKEPNPQDTLGEIYLRAGKFDEAEKAFQAALTIEPKFGLAWQGVALARGYRGDMKGALEAIDKGVAGAPPQFRGDGLIDGAWLKLAAGDSKGALADLAAVEKDAALKTTPAPTFAAMDRGHMLEEMGKHADAAKAYAVGLERSQSLPGQGKGEAAEAAALGALRSAALAGKPAADADKRLAEIEARAASLADDVPAQSRLAWARGLAAWAKGDAKAAAAEMSKCITTFVPCRYDLAMAQRKAGDAAAADATEKEIAATPMRDMAALYFASKLAKK
ncbi:MAG TPA: tetratricopeptide repeat protein [Kofleriaceae bacterium]|nr:tetratricopeptide repeat protein [Kofleriaceae bacterium]